MLSFFPRGVLDEILNLIESVSEGFPSYSCLTLTPVLITSFFPPQREMIPKIFSGIFLVCNKSFMISLGE